MREREREYLARMVEKRRVRNTGVKKGYLVNELYSIGLVDHSLQK
jgi:hypothetical protein